MGDRDLTFVFDEALAQITRPHRFDEALTIELRQCLCQLGVPCDESTPRADVIAQIWAKKRSLSLVA